MSKIKRYLKQQSQKDLDAIKDGDAAFEDKILPKFYEHRSNAISVKRNQFMIFLLLILAICIFAFVAIKTSGPKFSGTVETKTSDIRETNRNLSRTQMADKEWGVILTYDAVYKTPLFYTLSEDIVSEECQIQVSMEAIVSKFYQPKIEDMGFTQEISFLKYRLKYKESKTETKLEGQTVFEYSVIGFFSTGRERYLIWFWETSLNESSDFESI